MFFTKKRIIGIFIAALLFLSVASFLYIQTYFKVTDVEVVGNEHYTQEEIKSMILKDGMSSNSLFLSLKYKNKEIADIPFIESMSVEVTAPNAIQIMVYEKALAGCVKYLGNFIYFDREGLVVEISSERTESIPQVLGLQFSSFALNEPLPVADDAVFGEILDIAQLLEKNDIHATKIYFDESKQITLYFDEARVALGTSTDLDEKVTLLKNILPSLEGKSGILRMENYNDNIERIPFEMD